MVVVGLEVDDAVGKELGFLTVVTKVLVFVLGALVDGVAVDIVALLMPVVDAAVVVSVDLYVVMEVLLGLVVVVIRKLGCVVLDDSVVLVVAEVLVVVVCVALEGVETVAVAVVVANVDVAVGFSVEVNLVAVVVVGCRDEATRVLLIDVCVLVDGVVAVALAVVVPVTDAVAVPDIEVDAVMVLILGCAVVMTNGLLVVVRVVAVDPAVVYRVPVVVDAVLVPLLGVIAGTDVEMNAVVAEIEPVVNPVVDFCVKVEDVVAVVYGFVFVLRGVLLFACVVVNGAVDSVLAEVLVIVVCVVVDGVAALDIALVMPEVEAVDPVDAVDLFVFVGGTEDVTVPDNKPCTAR